MNTRDNLQLWTHECKMYHDGLIKLRSQVDFDRLLNLYLLDKIEDGDTSWQGLKILKYNEDWRAIDGYEYSCLVEWNNIKKTQLCIKIEDFCCRIS
jgi:hypothetical protein